MRKNTAKYKSSLHCALCCLSLVLSSPWRETVFGNKHCFSARLPTFSYVGQKRTPKDTARGQACWVVCLKWQLNEDKTPGQHADPKTENIRRYCGLLKCYLFDYLDNKHIAWWHTFLFNRIPIFLWCTIQNLHKIFVCISIWKQICHHKQVEKGTLCKHFLCAYLSSAGTTWVEGWQWWWLYGSCHHCWWAAGRRARRHTPPAALHWGCDEHAARGRRTHQSDLASTDPARTDETLHQTGMEETGTPTQAQL